MIALRQCKRNTYWTMKTTKLVFIAANMSNILIYAYEVVKAAVCIYIYIYIYKGWWCTAAISNVSSVGPSSERTYIYARNVTILSLLAVHQPFYISICIWTLSLPTQQLPLTMQIRKEGLNKKIYQGLASK